MDCHVPLQEIFPIRGPNPHFLCLLHCRRILYPPSHQGSANHAAALAQQDKCPHRTLLLIPLCPRNCNPWEPTTSVMTAKYRSSLQSLFPPNASLAGECQTQGPKAAGLQVPGRLGIESSDAHSGRQSLQCGDFFQYRKIIQKMQGGCEYDKCPLQLLLMEGVPHTRLRTLSHLILTLTLRGRGNYHPCFVETETKARVFN